jgi:predicted small lipoprotein YifL
MKKLLVISILAAALAACGSKPAQSTTPANKTTDTKKPDGSMGGAGYGAGSAMTPAAPSTGGDPCAN